MSIVAACGEVRVYQEEGSRRAVKAETFNCKRHSAPPGSRPAWQRSQSGGTLERLQLDWAAGKEPVLAPGSTVRGELLVAVRGGWLTFHSITAVLVGQMKVRHGCEDNTETIFKSAKRSLLNNASFCEDTTCCVLIEGDHAFDFSFTLPSEGLDTSMESRNCAVRYLVEAELVLTGGAFRDIRRAFTVIGSGTSGKKPLQSRIERCEERCVSLWPLRSATCRVRAVSDKSFYFPGESVSLDAVISNGCIWSVRASTSLIQTETVTVNSKVFTSRTKLTGLRGESCLVKARKELELRGQSIRVPPVCPSFSNSHIKVQYSVEISITHFDRELLVVSIPIEIMAVPAPSTSSASDPPGYWSCLEGVDIHYKPAGSPYTAIYLDGFLPLYGCITKPTSGMSEHDESLPSYVQATSLQEGQAVAIL